MHLTAAIEESPADEQVLAALTEALRAAEAGVPVALVRQRPAQQSTFPLERLEVGLEGGGRLQVAFKRLEWNALGERLRLAKPRFVFDPAREPAVYETLLPLAPRGAPRYLGSVPSDGGAGRWLFVEWVEGRELYQVGELSTWTHVASWLGRLHARLAACAERRSGEARLMRHDAAGYVRWARRARAFVAEGEAAAAARSLTDRLLSRYDTVAQALAEMPSTVIHGEFYPSNILVSQVAGTVRVAPVDWEMAAVGPGLLDLAALVSGSWSEQEREAMLGAYAAGAGASFSAEQVHFARLHHAVQRLGWAPSPWRPPASHRHDWLAEAAALADRLAL